MRFGAFGVIRRGCHLDQVRNTSDRLVPFEFITLCRGGERDALAVVAEAFKQIAHSGEGLDRWQVFAAEELLSERLDLLASFSNFILWQKDRHELVAAFA